jgi:membrane protein DedA with SNARE-associated domain
MESFAGLGYVALFLGTVFEGETFLISAGIAAHQGFLSLPLVILVAWFGAISGDHLFFALGYYKGREILRSRPRLAKRVETLLMIFRRQQVPFIGAFRFIWGFRMVAPIAIGLAGTRTRLFAIVNVLSGFAWSLTYAGLGYLFGASFDSLFTSLITRVLFVIAIVSLAIFTISRIMKIKGRDWQEKVISVDTLPLTSPEHPIINS